MREETLKTIKRYGLSIIQLGVMSGVSREKVRSYLNDQKRNHQYDSWIEEAVLMWKNELIKNRSRLLKQTGYAHLYQNTD